MFWDRFHEPWDELRAEIKGIEDDGDVVSVDRRDTSLNGPELRTSS